MSACDRGRARLDIDDDRMVDQIVGGIDEEGMALQRSRPLCGRACARRLVERVDIVPDVAADSR